MHTVEPEMGRGIDGDANDVTYQLLPRLLERQLAPLRIDDFRARHLLADRGLVDGLRVMLGVGVEGHLDFAAGVCGAAGLGLSGAVRACRADCCTVAGPPVPVRHPFGGIVSRKLWSTVVTGSVGRGG